MFRRTPLRARSCRETRPRDAHDISAAGAVDVHGGPGEIELYALAISPSGGCSNVPPLHSMNSTSRRRSRREAAAECAKSLPECGTVSEAAGTVLAWRSRPPCETTHCAMSRCSARTTSPSTLGTKSASSTRPADLGYYVGYKITQAYYTRQSDKRRALKDILQIGDFAKFLQASGYGAGL